MDSPHSAGGRVIGIWAVLGLAGALTNPVHAQNGDAKGEEQPDLPADLEVTAWTQNGIIMGVRHKTDPVEGIQFHPESIMTEVGKDILRNFLEM